MQFPGHNNTPQEVCGPEITRRNRPIPRGKGITLATSSKQLLDDKSLLQVDILCNDALLGKDHTLKFIYVTRWRPREPPLILQYRSRINNY